MANYNTDQFQDQTRSSVWERWTLSRRGQLILLGVMATLMMGSLWLIGGWAFERSLADMRAKLDARMSLYAANIVSALEKHEYLPILLARDPMITDVFDPSVSHIDLDNINRYLSTIRQISEVSAVYVMDKRGLTIVASNWDQADSFVGQNFRFRPYFKNAMQGRRGHYFALGTTSKIPGYYVSYPIGDLENPQGVIVVKVSLARLEEAWGRARESVFVTDSNGVAIVASAQEWLFRTLEPLNEKQRTQFARTRQYADAPLKALQVARLESLDSHIQKMHVRYPDPEGDHQNPIDQDKWVSAYVHQKPVLGTDWMLHYVFKASLLQNDVFDAVITAAMVWGVIITLTLLIIQRKRVIEARLDFQEQHRLMLEQAAEELEQRVERRTLALQKTNDQLEQEITERLRAERKARHTQDELVQAGKLAAIGQMAAGLTHEMNQPVTAIRNYAENARTFIERNSMDMAQQNLRYIADLCDHLGGIAGQLKVFARKSPVQVRAVHVPDAVNETLTLLKSGTRLTEINVIEKYDDRALWVSADQIRLVQVLLNVIRNAMEALENTDDPTIAIVTQRIGERVHITVHDNGIGIEDAVLEHVFNPFFTTKDVGKGLGLGLSISSRIVQDFGGVLKAYNHPEEGGAVFEINLNHAKGTL